MGSRDAAIARALGSFDDGGFKQRLTDLVAIPSTSQDPGHEADLHRYLDQAIRPWLEQMGFDVQLNPNPRAGFGPILTAQRMEDDNFPTILTYGHGDTVRGLEGPVARRVEPVGADGGGWSLVWPRFRRQQGTARDQPARVAGGAGRARRQAGVQREDGAGNRGGARLHRVTGIHRRARPGVEGRRSDCVGRSPALRPTLRRFPRGRGARSISTWSWIPGPAACIPAIGAA